MDVLFHVKRHDGQRAVPEARKARAAWLLSPCSSPKDGNGQGGVLS